MNRAIGAAGKRLADDLRRARGTSRDDDDLAGVLLFEPQRLFECVRIRLVQLEARVLIANPCLRFIDTQLPFARHDLFDADGYLHFPVASCRFSSGQFPVRTSSRSYSSNRLNNNATFVPPKPNEFDRAYWIDAARLVF